MFITLKAISVILLFFLISPDVFASGDDMNLLRRNLTETIKQDFEIVKDVVNKRPAARGGETYWLIHVKPKRSGHYALKYTFKYTHKFSHPEEGENELYIRVGENKCNRYNANNFGISNICLGDTIIVPIRLDQRTAHQFSLKSTYQDSEKIGKTENYYLPKFNENLPAINQLSKHLKFLGTTRSVMPHRNYGAQTIVKTAYFEALATGRFNFTATTIRDVEKPAETSKMNPLDALPIIIVKPGTPITALVFQENTINYSDNKRFSGHAGNNFLTKLLILQPGDVFAVEYSRFIEREEFSKKSVLPPQLTDDKDRKLVMYELPFAVNKDWSYNEWLINYLPKD